MTAYDQAIAERNTAKNELERIETEVQRIQHRYEELTSTPMATATSHHDTEQERNRLATHLTKLLSERSRWLDAYTHSEHAIQRELERLVHEWRGEVVHQEQEREQAATTEDAEEATRRRDHAQAELERREQQLNSEEKE